MMWMMMWMMMWWIKIIMSGSVILFIYYIYIWCAKIKLPIHQNQLDSDYDSIIYLIVVIDLSLSDTEPVFLTKVLSIFLLVLFFTCKISREKDRTNFLQKVRLQAVTGINFQRSLWVHQHSPILVPNHYSAVLFRHEFFDRVHRDPNHCQSPSRIHLQMTQVINMISFICR